MSATAASRSADTVPLLAYRILIMSLIKSTVGVWCSAGRRGGRPSGLLEFGGLSWTCCPRNGYNAAPREAARHENDSCSDAEG